MVFLAWFPLYSDLVESQEFKDLTPIEKLYTLLLISTYNQRGGQFYKSDTEVAVTLSCSDKTIRRARKRLVAMGLITCVPGWRDKRGKGMATKYSTVKWSQTSESGMWYAQFNRHCFNMMLNGMRRLNWRAVDVVVYSCLAYWQFRTRARYRDRGVFYITKMELRSLSGVDDIKASLQRLYDNFQYSCGARLFEYMGYQKITVSKWSTPTSPDEDENASKQAVRWYEEIQAGVDNRKATEDRKAQKRKKLARKKKAAS